MKRLIIIIWCSSIILLALGAWRYSSLSRHYVSTQGTVLQLYPMEHQSFEYDYIVSGTMYFGTTTAESMGRDLASVKVGDHLNVFYDAKHPGDSTAEPPNLRGIMSICSLIFSGTLLSLGSILYYRTCKRERIQAAPPICPRVTPS
jgi:hypothetical protein